MFSLWIKSTERVICVIERTARQSRVPAVPARSRSSQRSLRRRRRTPAAAPGAPSRESSRNLRPVAISRLPNSSLERRRGQVATDDMSGGEGARRRNNREPLEIMVHKWATARRVAGCLKRDNKKVPIKQWLRKHLVPSRTSPTDCRSHTYPPGSRVHTLGWRPRVPPTGYQ